MASHAPLLMNCNDRRWTPDAIAFNLSKHCGTPNYRVRKFFIEFNGATLFDAKLQTNSSTLVSSAITRQNSNGETYPKLKRNMLLLVDIRYRHLRSSCKSFCLIFSAKFLLSGKCIFSL
ncbi:alpha-L-arabinofuranosidase [Salix suchowensis]|nr:alpha-L-arabinofuranosidase [Salix suchowensis]